MATKTVAKASMEDKLNALRKKMAETDVGGEGGQGYWRPKTGRNIVRILPAVGDMEFFFQEVGRHYNLPGEAMEFCASFTTGGKEKCPICDLVAELYGGSKADRALAGKLRVKKQYWVNVVVRDKADKGGDTGEGPFMYTPGVMVFKSIQTLILDPEYGDISDPSEGIDLIVDRKGAGVNTEYEVQPRRYASPLHKDGDVADGWLDVAKDLSYVELSEDPDEDEELKGEKIIALLPYDRLLEKHGLGPGADVSELEEDVEVEKEEEPVRASTKRRSVGREDGESDSDENVVAGELKRRSRRR